MNFSMLPDWVQDHVTNPPTPTKPLSAQLVGVRSAKPAWLVELEEKRAQYLRDTSDVEAEIKRKLDRLYGVRNKRLCEIVTEMLGAKFGFRDHTVSVVDDDLCVTVFGHTARLRWLDKYGDDEIDTMTQILVLPDFSDEEVIRRVNFFVNEVLFNAFSFNNGKRFITIDNYNYNQPQYAVVDFYYWVTGVSND